eukprot:gene9801-biopygen8621
MCVMTCLSARIRVYAAEAPSCVIISGERLQMGRQVREWHHQRRRHHQQPQWQLQRRGPTIRRGQVAHNLWATWASWGMCQGQGATEPTEARGVLDYSQAG